MVDLCELSRRAFFHIDTKGSSSIKKVLSAILKSSTWFRDRYGNPIYGKNGGVSSRNFEDFTWCSYDCNGVIVDPYKLLNSNAVDLLGQPTSTDGDAEDFLITEGGAAAAAYSRLQFELLDDQSRRKINSALLRYCELDTLAMVMIAEGWRDLISKC